MCEYCGRTHLDVGLDDLKSKKNNYINNKNENLATIDHFFCVDQYPELYMNKSNWVVSCRKCNQKKSNRDPFEFISTNFVFRKPLLNLTKKMKGGKQYNTFNNNKQKIKLPKIKNENIVSPVECVL